MDHARNAHPYPETSVDPSDRGEQGDVIGQAVKLLGDQHHVREISAYTILVQASVDSRLSVRETAARLLEPSDEPG